MPTHIEGFVVIMVPADTAGVFRELDVRAKYTARHRNTTAGNSDVTTDVESLDVVEVHPKKITAQHG